MPSTKYGGVISFVRKSLQRSNENGTCLDNNIKYNYVLNEMFVNTP